MPACTKAILHASGSTELMLHNVEAGGLWGGAMPPAMKQELWGAVYS